MEKSMWFWGSDIRNGIFPVDVLDSKVFSLHFIEALADVSQHDVTMSAFDSLSKVIRKKQCQTTKIDLRLPRRLPKPSPIIPSIGDILWWVKQYVDYMCILNFWIIINWLTSKLWSWIRETNIMHRIQTITAKDSRTSCIFPFDEFNMWFIKETIVERFFNKWCSSPFKSMAHSKDADSTIRADNLALIWLELFCKSWAKHWIALISGGKVIVGAGINGSINKCYHKA